jgi:plasmid stability protein
VLEAIRWIFRHWYDIMISFFIEGNLVAQFVVRNIEDGVKARLQRRARRNGRSMEEEARDILRNAVNEPDVPSGGLGSEISALFTKASLHSDIPELRGHEIKPPAFEE